jgi:uncharacterized membrane protein
MSYKMKKRLFSISLVFLAVMMFFPGKGWSQGEHIQDFSSRITIDRDGTIDVIEIIVYDFGGLQRHGIIREIPKTKTNREGKEFLLKFDLVSVKGDGGESQPFRNESTKKLFKIRIGAADTYVTGEHTYKIHYRVSGALTYFSDHDELYWNVTGNEWTVPIENAAAVISFPAGFDMADIKYTGYTGKTGSRDQNVRFQLDGRSLSAAAADRLAAYQGLTVAVEFPIDVVEYLPPEEITDFTNTLMGKIVVAGLFLFAVFWFLALPVWIVIKWFIKGRDPKVFEPISAWFEPPKSGEGRELTPAETGTVIDEKVSLKELTSTIVHLAQRGYLIISEKKKNDFYLVKNKDFAADSKLRPFERTLLEGFFKEGDELRLKDAKLVSTAKKAEKQIYEQMVKEKFFPDNPNKIRTRYTVLSFAGLFTLNLPLLLSGLIFGRNMPKKTVKGAEAASLAKSLKNFLVSQKDQLEFQADKQIMFEKLLPFAIAFGVEKIWAKRFAKIKLKQPAWNQTYRSGVFSSMLLTRSLDRSFRSFRSAATPTSSSSGFSSGSSGGFSGGGGGGGGGSSW